MSVFVDTSALYALLDSDDGNHAWAARRYERLLDSENLLTSSYVLAESIALVRRRLGVDAVRALQRGLRPTLSVTWVDQVTHDAAVEAMLAERRRRLSLVDWVSFEVMRRSGTDVAFAFDRSYAEQGFRVLD